MVDRATTNLHTISPFCSNTRAITVTGAEAPYLSNIRIISPAYGGILGTSITVVYALFENIEISDAGGTHAVRMEMQSGASTETRIDGLVVTGGCWSECNESKFVLYIYIYIFAQCCILFLGYRHEDKHCGSVCGRGTRWNVHPCPRRHLKHKPGVYRAVRY